MKLSSEYELMKRTTLRYLLLLKISFFATIQCEYSTSFQTQLLQKNGIKYLQYRKTGQELNG